MIPTTLAVQPFLRRWETAVTMPFFFFWEALLMVLGVWQLTKLGISGSLSFGPGYF
ncbi:hypothetical protein AmDm5_0813 [Acetobacter malorum]|nr:hypothetical protein AmDm5_0813 [Acetobacter malorum]